MKAGALLLAAAASVLPAGAAQTRHHVPTPSDLLRGRAEGVAISSRGRLGLAPEPARLGGGARTASSTAWAAAADASGNVYVGTGPEGRVLKISPGGVESVLFSVDEPLVTALLALPGGELLAGTAPEGRIYRIRPDGRGEVWCETGERYVWALAAGPGGAVYAATGEQGIVLRIDAQGRATPFFDSDEAHVVSLAVLPGGGLLAGGAGRGLVYRIDREGHAEVLHDDDLPEVRDLAVEPGGAVVALLLAGPPAEARPPALRIRVPGETEIGATPGTIDFDDRPSPTLEGVIEGLPGTSEEASRKLRGRVVRIDARGVVREIWRSTVEAPYALLHEGDGPTLFGTGEPARLYRTGDDGDVSLLASFDEAQVVRAVRAAGRLMVVTSGPAAAYRIERAPARAGVFLSRPVDAGGTARWGTLSWRNEGGAAGIEMYTRTGTSAEPDETWSAWSPALTAAEGAAITNPPGRYLQWRLRLAGTAEDAGVSGVRISYLPRNRAPELRTFRLTDPAPAVAKEAAFQWSATDADGDPVRLVIEYRRPGVTAWTAAEGTVGSSTSDAEETRKEGRTTWDLAAVAEGTYEIRARATDQGANPPGEGAEDAWEPPLVLAVDRTPPEIRPGKDGTVVVEDAFSAVVRLEVLEGDRSLYAVACDDGVCDGRRETFQLPSGASGSPLALRATDAAGNVADGTVPAP